MVEFAGPPARCHLVPVCQPDHQDLAETPEPRRQAFFIRNRRHRVHLSLVRIATLPFPLLGGRKMRAPAIEAVMGRTAGLGTPAAQAGAERQGIAARAIMPRETCPWFLRDMGARLRKRKHGHSYTDGFRIWIMSHGGALGWLEEEGGGDVPALASSLHMLVKSGVWMFRLKARPWNAAVFASGSFLQSPGSHGVHRPRPESCKTFRKSVGGTVGFPPGLFSHLRRGDHSVPGSSLRLPTERGAVCPLSCRRCPWFRQFRDAVDTVPSFPEPSKRNINLQ